MKTERGDRTKGRITSYLLKHSTQVKVCVYVFLLMSVRPVFVWGLLLVHAVA